MIIPNLHRQQKRESHSIVCASLDIFIIHYGFPYMEAQNRISVKNSHSCRIPKVRLSQNTLRVVNIFYLPKYQQEERKRNWRNYQSQFFL